MKQIPDNIDIKWTKNEEKEFKNKRIELFNERVKLNYRGNINNFAFFENIH